MAAITQVYKCNICGNIVTILHPGGGALVCCGKPMELLVENTVDASKEKHVPVVTKVDGGFKVTVGSVSHPMEEKHYIEWIELQASGQFLRQHLEPGDAPEAFFLTAASSATARAYCNLHGLWQGN
ncbi:desulfoferrodoxin [Neomoorella thermoacetica]|uniref:Desulfoferrodoxin n=1 Tax=Neomoorella thermoacetica TaxID=1525 RepID=A0A5D3I875_NEOTH|nr:desulfoferrodoxin [Moorella thermoacetica]AOQ24012.1 Desulfoferrodoxin [Moorella thermoacetica]OIQ12964.1 desulfoferrodoxin [Moorella thermoacetica]OIQ56429.1 desulfoferrodoxin [Moorella thermoacetica]TYL14416.1 Desulfoferrodoxin [Moorella thermoacetica]